MISNNEVLRRYRADEFTDGDVARCTGLTVRAWRELIKLGAVRTSTEKRGPGRVRTCDATTFKRAALIAVLHQSGLSLAVAGRIAYLLPCDDMLYDVSEPNFILLDPTGKVDPDTGLLPRRQTPFADWFDPDKPATADPETDWLIEVYDGRFVAQIIHGGAGPMLYGELRDAATRFVAWFPFHHYIGFGNEEARFAKWQDPTNWADKINLRFLKYEYERHDTTDDPLRIAAEAAIRAPLFKSTFNLSLAIRKALRRYLGIEPALSDSTIGEVS
jgi:hypothetical protein